MTLKVLSQNLVSKY